MKMHTLCNLTVSRGEHEGLVFDSPLDFVYKTKTMRAFCIVHVMF